MVQATFHKLFDKYQRSILLRSASWYVVGTFAQKGVVFLTLPIFTRLLSTEEFGTVSIFITWVTIFTIIMPLNVSPSVVRAKFDYDEADYQRFLAAILSLGMITTIIGTTILLILPDNLTQTLFSMDKPLLLLAGFAVLVSLPVDIVAGRVWKINNQYQRYTIFDLVKNLLIVAFGIALILIPANFIADYNRGIGRILGIILVDLLVFPWFAWQIYRAGRLIIGTAFWRYALVYALPLIPHLLSGLILAQFDRVLIDNIIGRAEAGLYSYAYQTGQIVYMLVLAVNSAWLPWFMERMKRGDHAVIQQRSAQYIWAFTAITAPLVIISPLLTRLLAPPEYWSAQSVTPLIMSSSFFVFLNTLFVNIMLYEKKTSYISVGTMFAAATNILLNLWLMPIYGYAAGAWTTLFSYMILFVGYAVIIRLRFRDQQNTLPFPAIFGSAALVMLLTIVVFAAAQ